ncbi:hypothetical protein [Candidatus Endoriftia persephone]|jgi:hypothetical protein|uniref:DUF72 domain-containing protein n=3 Tax=Gammaproteobacteria TaxID=1236 RepID=G2FDW5_9GAMM|nr:hypothetical protein [Candidatus Endoriftia persephone]EGV51216.1 hypothetical protein Rifp1Sym_br00230 [endosymbiont of Riftia pachyptila (vent Ph05)]EGW54949.1 hypothetical protein TevJSym_ag00270 [endosymbiont of Tevnia jerichonana (vent Tica)]USF87896.1 ABC transporter permease [Candidatus Endoriftia persephone]
MTDNRPTVQIYARGWDHPAWQGSFYPEDLPADWRLTYYANEFPGVLLPQAVWADLAASTLLEWLDDLDDGFQLYLEIESPLEAQQVQLLEGWAGQLAGLVLRQGIDAESIETMGLNCYRLLRSDKGVADGEPAAFCIKPDARLEPRQQRALLERLSTRVAGDQELPLFLFGEPPDLDLLRQLRQLAQLMGLA